MKKVREWWDKRPLATKVVVLILLVGLVWFGFARIKRGSGQQVQYQTTTAEKGTLVATVTGSGSVSTANFVSVSTLASGVVTKVYVKDGESIKTGAKIVDMEFDMTGKQKSDQAHAAYLSAKNNLEAAKANMYSLQSKAFAANQKLINDAVARDLTTDDPTYIQQNADWLAAEAAYKNQQAVISQAQIAMNNTWTSYLQSSSTVYAPSSGYVSGLFLQPGSVISAGNSTGETATTSKIANITTKTLPTVTLNLTEIDIPQIGIGDKATVMFDAIADKTFTGKVVSIDKVGTTSSGVTTYPTVIRLDSDAEEVYPNMAASAAIITQTKDNVLIVPGSAVVASDGQSMVRVMREGQVQQIPVETGLSADAGVEIVSGIDEGEVVVTGVTQTGTTGSTQTSSPFGIGGGRGFGSGGGAVRIIR